ncbi:hypothetical protein WOLCODRAFT_73999 [Wolfiporia cocos MD-104 SS10]|uniref:Uncharacterized protein n=1 Tax=Wolfiporia cocos (strain MD-104) TaxID=742152 RepID=A0A2H3JN14_WOLCO|nr:hypothetical protein WOLCODRAFT_73999 [Wolfiporia cocos MD-104 SS10]
MSRLAMFAAALVGLASVVSASPVADNTVLDKWVTHEGWATWYDAGLSACRYTDSDSNYIVAISHDIYGSGGNCNQWIAITWNGATHYGKTRDECEACDATNDTSCNLKPTPGKGGSHKGAFLVPGLEDVTWHFMAKGWSP